MSGSTDSSDEGAGLAGIADQYAQVIELLEKKRILDSSSIARLKRAMNASGDAPIFLVQQLGLAKESEVVAAISAVAKTPIARDSELQNATLHGLSLTFLRNAKIVPLRRSEGALTVAMADPFDDAATGALSYQLGLEIERCTAPLSAVERALASLAAFDQPGRSGSAAGPTQADIDALKDIASDAPVIKHVAAIFDRATDLGASDVHFEPTEDVLRIRFRIDGALRDMEPTPFAFKSAVISRLKILAQLDTAETRLPQDGRAKIAVRGADIDLRVSTTPTLHGESVVVRILDRSAVNLDLASLGFSAADQEAIVSMLNSPHGLFLVTGPTGSGKTTTLYAGLKLLNDPRRKIFSVEDPVEYRISGVNQVQVNPKIGLTFATALRSLLRQDPDIMMVGEIRDPETAAIAVQAALTGHLVLATLHTNTAVAAISRLVDMGIEEYLIGASLVGVLAQRLVGRLCRNCASQHEAPVDLLKRYGIEPSGSDRFLRPVGCEKCSHVGYSGRTTISEILKITPEIEAAILRRENNAVIERLATEAGMCSMGKDGLIKALGGATSAEEVLRAIRS